MNKIKVTMHCYNCQGFSIETGKFDPTWKTTIDLSAYAPYCPRCKGYFWKIVIEPAESDPIIIDAEAPGEMGA